MPHAVKISKFCFRLMSALMVVPNRLLAKLSGVFQIPREELVPLSKCYLAVDESGDQPFIAQMSNNGRRNLDRSGLSHKHVIDAVKKSVKRLGTYFATCRRFGQAAPPLVSILHLYNPSFTPPKPIHLQ